MKTVAPGVLRAQRFRDNNKKNGFVYVTMWVHADDAGAVRAYARAKNSRRFRGKKAAAADLPT